MSKTLTDQEAADLVAGRTTEEIRALPKEQYGAVAAAAMMLRRRADHREEIRAYLSETRAELAGVDGMISAGTLPRDAAAILRTCRRDTQDRRNSFFRVAEATQCDEDVEIRDDLLTLRGEIDAALDKVAKAKAAAA